MKQLFLILILTLSILSCNRKGCTDCNAVNYNSKAKVDDNSCQYALENFIGTYSVSDSIFGPPTATWEKRNYNIGLTRAGCNADQLAISNYAKQSNSFLVNSTISGNNLSIPIQSVNQVKIRVSSGFFRNDSIFFEFEFENEFGEVFFGSCYGEKL